MGAINLPEISDLSLSHTLVYILHINMEELSVLGQLKQPFLPILLVIKITSNSLHLLALIP